MKFGKMGSGLFLAFFSAGTLGLATTGVCSAHGFGGAHVSHHTPALRSMHTSSHHQFSGHGERGHNMRHNEMSRREGWGRRDEHNNFNRGHEANNFRHNEMSGRDQMRKGNEWRGRNERDRNFRRDQHQNQYLGQHSGQRQNTNTNNPEAVLKGPNRSMTGTNNQPLSPVNNNVPAQ